MNLSFLLAISFGSVAVAGQYEEDTMCVLQTAVVVGQNEDDRIGVQEIEGQAKELIAQQTAIFDAEIMASVVGPLTQDALTAYTECKKRIDNSVWLAIEFNQSLSVDSCNAEAEIVQKAMNFASSLSTPLKEKEASLLQLPRANMPARWDCYNEWHKCALCKDRVDLYKFMWEVFARQAAYWEYAAIRWGLALDRDNLWKPVHDMKPPICVTGRWHFLKQYQGSDDPLQITEIQLCRGRESTTETTREESWSTEASATLSAGFSVGAFGATAEVSASVTTTAGRELAMSSKDSLSLSKQQCDKEWVYLPDRTSGKPLWHWGFEMEFRTFTRARTIFWPFFSPIKVMKFMGGSWDSDAYWKSMPDDVLRDEETVERFHTKHNWFTDSKPPPSCIPGGCEDTWCRTCSDGFKIE